MLYLEVNCDSQEEEIGGERKGIVWRYQVRFWRQGLVFFEIGAFAGSSTAFQIRRQSLGCKKAGLLFTLAIFL